MITDGFGAILSLPVFDAAWTLLNEEISVTPAGLEGGGAIEQTTLRNVAYRTQSPKSLKNGTSVKVTVVYDGATAIGYWMGTPISINNGTVVNVKWPDGAYMSFVGHIDSFTPNALVEGERPTAELEIIILNADSAGTESAPAYSPAP